MAAFVPLGEQQEDEDAVEAVPVREKVIALINDAQMVPKEQRIICLNQIKELIINKEPDLLDSFMDEVIAFQQDQSPEVRKFVVSFMEEASKKDSHLLVRVIPTLAYMMEDRSTIVIKKLLASVIQIYKLALMYIAKMKMVDSDTEEMWETLQDIKQKVCSKVESENDGVRTIAIKFMESLILAQTKREGHATSESEMSLDVIPPSHPLLNAAELKEEAGTTMGGLLQITVSPVVSSVNLMTCIISLATIAKQRPSFITTVVQAFELLHANLPTHFATSQISSVRKQLKTQVLGLLRHLSTFECKEQITTLLTDLGCTQAEIAKNTPKMSHEAMKRSRVEADSTPHGKKMRYSTPLGEPSADLASKRGVALEGVASSSGAEDKPAAGSSLMEAIEMTTNDLRPLLTPDAVTELVIVSMEHLPSDQPPAFGASYTPIAAAGTDPQRTHLARLLASQMTSAGIGVGAIAKGIKPQLVLESPGLSSPLVRDPRGHRKRPREEGEDDRRRKKIKEEDKGTTNLEKSMAELSYLGSLLGLPDMLDPSFPMAFSQFFGRGPTIGAGSVKTEAAFVQESNLVAIPTTPLGEESKELVEAEKKKRKLQATLPQRMKKIEKFDLTSLVRPLNREERDKMSVAAFKRILESEKVLCKGGASQARIRLIVTLVTMFDDFSETLLEFILEDLRGRFDIATSWLFAEYSIAEGYTHSLGRGRVSPGSPSQYTQCLTALMLGAKAKLNPRDRLFTKLVLEAPKVTPEALEIVASYCQEEERAFLGVTTLRELVLRRPQGPRGTDDFLQALLEITVSDIELARIQAMHIAKKFYTNPDLTAKIERFALQKVQLLLHDHPAFEQPEMEDMAVAVEWTEASVKLCFSLFVTLLPLNHKLLRDLAFIYTGTTRDVKKIILKQLDQPVRSVGMDSPDLLLLVQNCPAGAETLIMRMLHILTDGTAPSAELVNRVRELYQRSSSDVRFLIPVLHGLSKEEVISALPKFVRLNPNLVKGILDRLLHRGEQGHSISPITPSELLIALHNVDCTNDDALMKDVIKATNLCFQEKSIFTQEVLAAVLQLLLEQDPIPVLFMRTVLQSLGLCPKLISFIMTILVKLIGRKVWNQPKVWQGFIKCCEVTKPHSFQVLLKLPAQQLEAVFKHNPSLRLLLHNHTQKLPIHQKAAIPRSILSVLEKSEEKASKPKSEKKRRQSSQSNKSEKSETENQENTAT